MLPIVLSIYAVMSLVTFLLYGWDKRCAARSRRRIPEQTLHAFEFLGGWPGALIGQQVFRHKRRKIGFMLVTILIVLAHLAVWGYVIYSRS